MCFLRAKPIGLMPMLDQGEQDDKVPPSPHVEPTTRLLAITAWTTSSDTSPLRASKAEGRNSSSQSSSTAVLPKCKVCSECSIITSLAR